MLVTTNFDQLMERALAEVGVTPQVLTSERDIAGMTPLMHAECTLVKLHGDFASGRLRNAADELDEYPEAWHTLLAQIFDSCGLMIVGWSAEWDGGLRSALLQAVGRRYAWYWAKLGEGPLPPLAAQLVVTRGAFPINTSGSDELLEDLWQRVVALDRAVARDESWEYTQTSAQFTEPVEAWNGLPLISLSVSVGLDAAVRRAAILIGGTLRSRLADELNRAPLTARLLDLSRRPAVSAAVATAGQPASPEAKPYWEMPRPMTFYGYPHAPLQAADHVVMRWGTDGVGGLSAVLIVSGNGRFGGSAVPTLTLRVGVSVEGGLTPAEIMELQYLAALALTATVTDVLRDALSPSPLRIDMAWGEPINVNGVQRELTERHGIDATRLGQPTRPQRPCGQYAELVGGPVTAKELAELVVRAWGLEMFNSGYVYAEPGLAEAAAALRNLSQV